MCKQFFFNGITLPQLVEALAPLLQKTVKEPQQETKDFNRTKRSVSYFAFQFYKLNKHPKSAMLKSVKTINY